MTTLVLAAVLAVGAPVAETPAAQVVVDAAVKQAKETKRNVYVVFHASWCGWCKRHDAFMALPEFKPFYDKNFVVTHLTVMETPEKKAAENAGGEGLMKKWGGENAGLPFMAVLNEKGELVVNSMRPEGEKKSNIGHPAAPEEVGWYKTMLEKGAKYSTAEERNKIGSYLQAQKFG